MPRRLYTCTTWRQDLMPEAEFYSLGLRPLTVRRSRHRGEWVQMCGPEVAEWPERLHMRVGIRGRDYPTSSIRVVRDQMARWPEKAQIAMEELLREDISRPTDWRILRVSVDADGLLLTVADRLGAWRHDLRLANSDRSYGLTLLPAWVSAGGINEIWVDFDPARYGITVTELSDGAMVWQAVFRGEDGRYWAEMADFGEI